MLYRFSHATLTLHQIRRELVTVITPLLICEKRSNHILKKVFMTITLIKAPFKADHVGSLLRPENLHKAGKDYQIGKITAEQLRGVENPEIKPIVDKQIEVGLEA